MKIVGVRHQTGDFNNMKYDNYYLYGVGDQNNNDDVQYYGVCPQCVKVKASVLHQVCAADKVNKLIDRNVEFYYDAYKNVCVVNVENK